MTPPSPTELQIFAAACGVLISGSFMRFVVKTPPKSAAMARKDRSRDKR